MNKGRAARRKGHDFERRIAALFRRWFPDARRGLQYQDGTSCPDIVEVPFYVECKRRKRFSNTIGYFQNKVTDRMVKWAWSTDNDRPTRIFVVYKADRQPIMVSMDRVTAVGLGLAIPDDPGVYVSYEWGKEFTEAMDKVYGKTRKEA
jgi:hypothetical protein